MQSTRKPHPKLTPQRIAELSELASKIDADEAPAIKAKGRAVFARRETIRNIIFRLREARQEQGLSLSEVGERSGIGKANLSRLENTAAPNPTWDTIVRYAEAVGRKVELSLR